MRKYAHFVLLFLVAVGCTLSMSATTVERPQASPALASAPTSGDFGAADFSSLERPSTTPDIAAYGTGVLVVTNLDRPRYKSQLQNSKPNTFVGRPSPTPDSGFQAGSGGSDGMPFVNLDRPHFNTRSQNPNPNAPARTPEPGSLALLASGLMSGLYFVRRRK